MKKTGFLRRLLCIILVLFMMAVSAGATATEADMSVMQGCRTIEAQRTLYSGDERLNLTCSALLYDVTNDVLLYADEPDATFNPAGLVKMMTAYVIAEEADLTEEVTVKQEILDSMYESRWGMEFQAGEVTTLHELLYCILVQNSNLAALIAADHVCGSEEAFVQKMNEYAIEMGCTSTNFANVHGMSDERQLSTARDYAKITVAAMKNEDFAEAFCTYAYRLKATNMSEERVINSDNFLFNRNLGSNHFESRATGSRMGLTGAGEYNIVVLAENRGVELISIIMGSTSPINPNGEEGCYKEARILLDIGFNMQAPVQILHENQILERFQVENGANDVSAYVKVSQNTSLPIGTVDENLTYRYIKDLAALKAPIKADKQLSVVQIWYQNVCLAQTEMYAAHDVDVQEAVVRNDPAEEQDSNPFAVLIVVAVIVGLLVVLLFGRTFVIRLIRKRQLRRHSRIRRRRR